MASILNIGSRLEAIVELCPDAKKIADIGCDHGYVACELVLQSKADMVVATEKSLDCLNKAVSLADSINIMPFISFRQGDGFEAITKYDKLDCAVIAGMGGVEIIKILSKKPKKLYDFVLQPQSDVILLRRWLVENKFNILVDKLVKDGDKYYNVLRVTKGKCNLADLELYFGKTNFTDNYIVFYEYLTQKQKKLMDFKAEVGGLSSKLQQELDYVNAAISLFETATEQTDQTDKK